MKENVVGDLMRIAGLSNAFPWHCASKLLLLTWFTFLTCLPTLAQTTVTGIAVAEDGTPVPSATVTAVRMGTAFSGRTVTDAKGAFSLTGLIAGDYAACVKANVRDLLDSCTWKLGPQDFRVLPGQKQRSNIRLVVKRGYPIAIRINDPFHLLTATIPGLVRRRKVSSFA